ncbi:MAG TPA: FAD-dependent oxidoreductase [Flavisolibacter sp.]|nr:FAD-dependent oxidoreductase [Flavisolibacter sp.]
MDLRTHYPYSLLRYGLIRSYPSLDRSINTDVAIIGAGITGALVAWHLLKNGIKCTVLDKRHVAMGSTAASTSLIQYEIDQSLHRLIDLHGHSKATRCYKLCYEAIGQLQEICKATGNNDNFQKQYSLQFASYKKDVAALEIEYGLRKKLGFPVDLLGKNDLEKQFGFSAPAALLSGEAAQTDAYLLTHALLRSAQSEGAAIYDHTEIDRVSRNKKMIVLTTNEGHTVRAKKLVIACGYESGGYINKKLEDLRCTYAFASEPLQQSWVKNCLIWETSDPYIYIRSTPDNRVIVGGKDTAYMPVRRQLAALPRKVAALQQSFQKLFPATELKPDFSWAGAFAATADGLPYIDTHPRDANIYFALGYGGNGIIFSLIAARLIASSIKGARHPDWELFSFNR